MLCGGLKKIVPEREVGLVLKSLYNAYLGMRFIKRCLKMHFGKGCNRLNTLVLLFPDDDAEVQEAAGRLLEAHLKRQLADRIAIITSVGADFAAGLSLSSSDVKVVRCSEDTMKQLLNYWTICCNQDIIKVVSLKMPLGRNLQYFKGKGDFTTEFLIWHCIFEQVDEISEVI